MDRLNVQQPGTSGNSVVSGQGLPIVKMETPNLNSTQLQHQQNIYPTSAPATYTYPGQQVKQENIQPTKIVNANNQDISKMIPENVLNVIRMSASTKNQGGQPGFKPITISRMQRPPTSGSQVNLPIYRNLRYNFNHFSRRV